MYVHKDWSESLCTFSPVLSGHSKRRPEIVFSDGLSLNAGTREEQTKKGGGGQGLINYCC